MTDARQQLIDFIAAEAVFHGDFTLTSGKKATYYVDLRRVILDPGLGFAKRPEHNWQLLGRLDELASLGHPLLVGASRKRFLSPWGAEPAERDEATAIVSALAANAGVWGVRVHDVASTRAALEITEAWQNGRTDS